MASMTTSSATPTASTLSSTALLIRLKSNSNRHLHIMMKTDHRKSDNMKINMHHHHHHHHQISNDLIKGDVLAFLPPVKDPPSGAAGRLRKVSLLSSSFSLSFSLSFS